MVGNNTTAERSGPSGSSSTSLSLLERVAARDPQAWRQLIELYTPMIYGWCRHCGVQAEDAADIGQEVFASIAKNLPNFRRDEPGATFRGWLWTITRNKIRDFFRRYKDAPQGQGGSAAYQRLAELPAVELETTITYKMNDNRLELRAVELVRASVEERTWQAFWLTTVEGREPADVAQSLGISTQAVYGTIYRVRRRIRQELEGLE